MRRTKILATIGPASNKPETIKKMIESGLSAARFNFSHFVPERDIPICDMVKKVREEMGVPLPFILDTKGPEIRTKTLKDGFENGKVFLEQGKKFTLTTADVEGDETRVSITYENLTKDVKAGNRILIDDGLIELKVLSVEGTEIHCELLNSGFLGNKKGVNVPDVHVDLPALTEKDINDIKFGCQYGFDYVAASFIRTASDVREIRKVLEENGGGHIQIISKIESRDGVDNLDEILEATDGIMGARGDLGVEIPPEEVPAVQKEMIRKCNLAGKLVVTATQMLESMQVNPRPTRAEANDVYNAIMDGTDCVMLSGESANGKYPVESVAMMNRIAIQAESKIDYTTQRETYRNNDKNSSIALGHAAMAAADDLDAACIVPITDSGFMARMVSRSRPKCPVLAITSNDKAYRQLGLTWGCLPVLVSDSNEGDEKAFDVAAETAMKTGLAKKGDTIVALAGMPVKSKAKTNTMRIHTV